MSVTPKETAAPWQEGLSHPLERLSSMYDNAELSDLTITFPNDERSLKVHRLILAMSSSVFEAMFYGPMAEKENLTLPEDPPAAFAFLMEYIYKGNTSLPNIDMAVMVYKLASKYQMSSLHSVCSEYLQLHIDLNNLALLYEISFVFEDAKLKQKCRNVVSESQEILSSPHIGQLSLQCMEDLLQQELPVESEVAVFKGLLQWGTLHSENFSISAKGLRHEIEMLLPHIRFLTMTVDDIAEHVMPSWVLTLEESAAILMNIKRVLNISLPAICSPNRETRVFNFQLHQISLRIGNNVFEKPTIIKPDWAPEKVDFGFFKKETFIGQNNVCVQRPSMRELLSGLKVNKDILVGCIEIAYVAGGASMCGSNSVQLEIRNSSGILRETKVIAKYSGRNVGISGILEKPVLLSPNDVYSIYLSSSHHQQQKSNVSLTYGNLNINGMMSGNAVVSLTFWCLSKLF